MKFKMYATTTHLIKEGDESFILLKSLGFRSEYNEEMESLGEKTIPAYIGIKDEYIDIEIDSLEELMDIAKKVSKLEATMDNTWSIIIKEEDGINYIEIYNDYRE